MAIELGFDKKRKIPLWVTIASVAIAGLFLAFAGTYLYFYFSNKEMNSRIEEVNESIVPLEKAIKEKEELLVLQQQRISDFEALLLGHKKVENLFAFLEKNTIPSIWFSDFGTEENGIALKGKSPSFLTIEQQIKIFSSQEEVEKVNLSDLSITKEGEVEFSLGIDFNPAIFKHNFYSND